MPTKRNAELTDADCDAIARHVWARDVGRGDPGVSPRDRALIRAGHARHDPVAQEAVRRVRAWLHHPISVQPGHLYSDLRALCDAVSTSELPADWSSAERDIFRAGWRAGYKKGFNTGD